MDPAAAAAAEVLTTGAAVTKQILFILYCTYAM